MLSTLACGTLAAEPARAQDIAAGGVLFRQRCQLCHVVTPDARATIGPNLAGVANRPAASTGFAYSAALKASGLKWDKATLDRFLTAPGKVVPGTRMVFAVPDATQRAQVVAYLMSLKK